MAFGGDFEEDKGSMSDINMTPLVDVMLVLLIIFIIAVPVLTQSVKVDLPRADNTPIDIKPNTINLSVTKEGQIHWNEATISADELDQRLSIEAAKQPQPEVHIRGDRKVDYEQVLKVMSAVQRSGILKLGFVSEPGG